MNYSESPTPLQIGTGQSWASVYAGSSGLCAINTNGELFCLGNGGTNTWITGREDLTNTPNELYPVGQ